MICKYSRPQITQTFKLREIEKKFELSGLIAELSGAKRPQRSTMGKKMW